VVKHHVGPVTAEPARLKGVNRAVIAYRMTSGAVDSLAQAI
jgi:predicted urease superfamily metal-dependent hydrolase